MASMQDELVRVYRVVIVQSQHYCRYTEPTIALNDLESPLEDHQVDDNSVLLLQEGKVTPKVILCFSCVIVTKAQPGIRENQCIYQGKARERKERARSYR